MGDTEADRGREQRDEAGDSLRPTLEPPVLFNENNRS